MSRWVKNGCERTFGSIGPSSVAMASDELRVCLCVRVSECVFDLRSCLVFVRACIYVCMWTTRWTFIIIKTTLILLGWVAWGQHCAWVCMLIAHTHTIAHEYQETCGTDNKRFSAPCPNPQRPNAQSIRSEDKVKLNEIKTEHEMRGRKLLHISR